MGLKQKYRVIEKLDAGGMAEVFRGRALSFEGIEKEVAIKRVLPNLTKKKKFMSMFLDEARLSMRLNHANIVSVFDVGRSGGTYFVVMEFVHGLNLRQLFQRASERGYRIPLQVACFIMAEVCKGLASAHEARDDNGQPLSIVHRDVSPPNIMLSRAGEVKLVDFGLAKAVTQVTMTDPGIVKGKFSYLSPEAAEGITVDHRADIFSAGIVLFELLTNRQLFRGKTDVETLELVRKAEIPPLSKLNPEVPESFERIVGKALHKDPKQRYQSARDLGDDLSRFLFDNALKVTSYDVQALYKRLVEDPVEQEQGDGRQRIEDLIEEEILNLSMIGHLTEVTSEGSRPINVEALHIDLPSQHDISDVWNVPAPADGMDIAPPGGQFDAMQQSDLTERLEGDDPIAPPPQLSIEEQRRQAREKEGGLSAGALIMLGILLAGIIAAVLVLFVF